MNATLRSSPTPAPRRPGRARRTRGEPADGGRRRPRRAPRDRDHGRRPGRDRVPRPARRDGRRRRSTGRPAVGRGGRAGRRDGDHRVERRPPRRSPGGRTIAFGSGRGRTPPRSGSTSVRDPGSDAEGWWAMWWQGAVRASGHSAVDKASIVIGSAPPSTARSRRGSGRRPGGWIRRRPAPDLDDDPRARPRGDVRERQDAGGTGRAARDRGDRRHGHPSATGSGSCPAPRTARPTRRSR